MYNNFCRVHHPSSNASNGSWIERSRLEHRGTGRIIRREASIRIKRVCLYFAVALVLEFALFLSGSARSVMIFLIPGMILSSLISYGVLSLVIGLAVNAVFYTYLALSIEKAIRRTGKAKG